MQALNHPDWFSAPFSLAAFWQNGQFHCLQEGQSHNECAGAKALDKK